MKLVLTTIRYDWNKETSEEFQEKVAKLYKKWTGRDEVQTYTDVWVTDKEYLDNWGIFSSVTFAREV